MRFSRLFALALVLALGVVGLEAFGPAWWRYRAEVEAAQPYLDAVQALEREQGRVPSEPDVLARWRALGLEVSEACPCYSPRDAGYIVWVGGGLGTSYVYDSGRGGWAEEE